MQKSCFRPSRSPLPKLARQCFMLVSMVVPCTLTLSERARLSGTDGEMKMTQVLPNLGDAHLGVRGNGYGRIFVRNCPVGPAAFCYGFKTVIKRLPIPSVRPQLSVASQPMLCTPLENWLVSK